jgi:hypothetical protein
MAGVVACSGSADRIGEKDKPLLEAARAKATELGYDPDNMDCEYKSMDGGLEFYFSPKVTAETATLGGDVFITVQRKGAVVVSVLRGQ